MPLHIPDKRQLLWASFLNGLVGFFLVGGRATTVWRREAMSGAGGTKLIAHRACRCTCTEQHAQHSPADAPRRRPVNHSVQAATGASATE
eukprot:8683493-Pyramimonas_sp.AAC.1